MENGQNEAPRRPVRRRRRRNPVYVFIHSYLPILAVALLVILFIIFAANSLRRSRDRRELARQESIAVMESSLAEKAAWDAEAETLLAQASAVAAGYDGTKIKNALRQLNSKL